jgi:hypothetical protein
MTIRARIIAAALLAGGPVTYAADADALIGVHFWGDRNDAAPAEMLDSQVRSAFDLEIVNTGNPEWNDVDVVAPLYQNFATTYNVTPITRLGYYWGKTLPAPGSPEYASWPDTIASNVVSPLKNVAHLWQLGNEPNLMGEATNWTNQQITPAAYATVYRDVRTAIGAPALVGTAGAHKLLIAPVSPGGAGGDRWMAGATWLDQTLADIPAAEVDGVALHAYGGGATARQSLEEFRRSLLEQVAVVDNRGLAHVPLYLTEWNRQTPIGSGQEPITADFAQRALKFIDRWNRTPGNHNIVGTNWFVYDGGDGTGTWDSYSIEHYRNSGATGAGDLYNAFAAAARQNYKAGVAGTLPIPAGVRIFDDFEADDGHFAGATPAPAGSPTTTGTSSASFKVRQSDTDSYTQLHAHKIGIVDDATNPDGWSVRYVSGGGSPSNNTPIALTGESDGFVGFFLRVYSVDGSEDLDGAGAITTQLVLDSGPTGGGINSDAGIARTIVADGEWHFYEWSLDNPLDWTAWPPAAGSDGRLGTGGDFASGSVTIDSIMFHGGNFNAELLLDTVMHNANGRLSVMAVPEPSASTLLLTAMLLRRRMTSRR